MIPNFHDNDLIICLKHFYSLKEGDVILIKTPALGVIIKRIKNIKEKKILIEGDNKEYSSKLTLIQILRRRNTTYVEHTV